MQDSTHPFIINNQPRTGNSKPRAVISPWDNQAIAEVGSADIAEAQEALENSQAAFASWGRTSLSTRLNIMRQAILTLRTKEEELGQLLSKEIGKHPEEAISEVKRSIDYLGLVMEAVMHMKGQVYYGDMFDKYPRGRKTGLYNRVPLGVVLAIAPFNYPINLSITKVAPALLAGNTVVLKPPTQGSLTSLAFYKHLIDAGLPAGVLNIVTGSASEIGDHLVSNPIVKLIAFTGSTEVGEDIGRKSLGVPLLTELGGKDIGIVMQSADQTVAAKEIATGCFSYSGQRCTAQKLIMVEEVIAEEFIPKLIDNSNPIQLNPMIDNKAADFVEELIKDALDKGAKQLMGGARSENTMPKTILDNVTPEMRVFHEEQFGPIMPIVRVQDEADALAKAAMSKFGLQASIYTTNLEQAFRMADHMDVGTVQINGKPDRGPDNFPFGGVKGSGQAMQATIETIELMTRGKMTVVNLHNFSR